MSSNEKERNNHSRGHGPMRVSEKPKDFMGSIKKLMKSLSSFKVLMFYCSCISGFIFYSFTYCSE